MTFRPKLWLGVGAFALAGTTSPAVADSTAHPDPINSASSAAADLNAGKAPRRVTFAQVSRAPGEGGEGGESGERRERRISQGGKSKKHGSRSRRPPRQPALSRNPGHGGEGGERGPRPRSDLQGGEGGERGGAGRAGPSGQDGLQGQGGEGGEGGVNTRYIFGFTEGADTEKAGEREFENDTVARFGKRAGSYAGVQNKSEFEYGITNDLMAEFGTYFSAQRIRNVPDLDNRSGVNFDGLSTELKYRLLDRATQPFGLALSAEPEWRRFSGTSGRREDSYAVELKLFADKEIIPNKVFVAANLLYEPEIVRVREFDADTGRLKQWERESTFGVSGAIAGALTDRIFLGAELRYLSKFEGSFLNRFEGQALYAGPTLSVRVLPNAVLQAAYSVQVAGHSIDEPNRKLDLNNFERRNARIRFVYEF